MVDFSPTQFNEENNDQEVLVLRRELEVFRDRFDILAESYQEHNHTLFDGTRLIDEDPALSPLVKSLLLMGG